MKKTYRNRSFKKGLIFILIITSSTSYSLIAQSSEWVAPKAVDLLNNPFKGDQMVIQKGAKLYTQYCAICHGDKGKGNGLAGMSLNPKPTNFQTEKFQKQSDGAIFWKLTSGKPPMAPYKDILKDDQRWELVNYVRTLKKK